MSDTPSDLPTVCPYLVVPDADAVLRFLESAFGATEQSLQRTPGGAIMHAELRMGDSIVMLGEKAPGRQASLHLRVDDVDATYAQALLSGGRSEREPEDQSYGSRSAGVSDPGGNIWWLAGPLR